MRPDFRRRIAARKKFQFTHPGRGATDFDDLRRRSFDVSIHAPREGCDTALIPSDFSLTSFNSRTPGGVRLRTPIKATFLLGFNSRTPGGVRHKLTDRKRIEDLVSIHAPREGCDRHDQNERDKQHRFNSRTPGGVRRARGLSIVHTVNVSIHAPREGCDHRVGRSLTKATKFQFTHPGRGATAISAFS